MFSFATFFIGRCCRHKLIQIVCACLLQAVRLWNMYCDLDVSLVSKNTVFFFFIIVAFVDGGGGGGVRGVSFYIKQRRHYYNLQIIFWLQPKVVLAKHVAARVLCLIALPLAVYFALFVVHFAYVK